jgi:hypothetical protein
MYTCNRRGACIYKGVVFVGRLYDDPWFKLVLHLHHIKLDFELHCEPKSFGHPPSIVTSSAMEIDEEIESILYIAREISGGYTSVTKTS